MNSGIMGFAGQARNDVRLFSIEMTISPDENNKGSPFKSEPFPNIIIIYFYLAL